MATMGYWFDWVRFAGAAYLVWLGIKLIRSPIEGVDANAPPPPPRGGFFLQGFLVLLSNPKVLVFFGAFIPQFMDMEKPHFPQVALLGATFMVTAVISDAIYALLAGRGKSSAKRTRMVRASLALHDRRSACADARQEAGAPVRSPASFTTLPHFDFELDPRDHSSGVLATGRSRAPASLCPAAPRRISRASSSTISLACLMARRCRSACRLPGHSIPARKGRHVRTVPRARWRRRRCAHQPAWIAASEDGNAVKAIGV
jgi:hypothetical protein